MNGDGYPHIFLAGPDRTLPFTSPRQGGGKTQFPPRDPAGHGAFLRRRLDAAWQANDDRQAVFHADRHGIYLDFVSEPGFDLVVKSLENLRSGIRLLNVRDDAVHGGRSTKATVFIPFDQRRYFLKKLQAYAEETTKADRPRHQKLIGNLADIRRSLLESFWTDSPELLPGEEANWVEAWLSSDNEEIAGRFRTLLQAERIERSESRLTFPERTILMIRTNRAQLDRLIELSDDIAELRSAKELASFFIAMENRLQAERVRELLARARYRTENDVVITILDTGVNKGHALLEPVLADVDLHAVDPAWGTHDHKGHGTLMAGTATYGDLLALLNTAGNFIVGHILESVKILPPPPAQNTKELWGYITAQGVSLAEIQAPARKRVSCLAVTASDHRDQGRPSSWSATIDELTSGAGDNIRRLFIVSAGNVIENDEFLKYPESNQTNLVHDPGQSWNAVTVGAYTEKTRIEDPQLRGYTPIAPEGGLSPYSTTSLAWERRKWPIKPEVLFEGGNVARGPIDSICESDDLKLISTSDDPREEQFRSFGATSAAAAQAARMAAVIQVRYPRMWPETIRAMLVHATEWTEAMRDQFLPHPPDEPTKAHYANLLRICGYPYNVT